MGIPEDLRDALDSAVSKLMSRSGRTAVAFSGGLDSGIVAAMASVHGPVKLYTVGTAGSFDPETSGELAAEMGLEWEHIVLDEDGLEGSLRDMIRITGTVNPITLSFEIPLFYVLRHSTEDVVLSGQGADEVFAGYAKYENLGADELRDQMDRDMMELMRNTIGHEAKVARHFSKTVGYPYLDKDVTDIVERIDIRDLAPKDVRKSFLRDVALLIGQPEIAAKPKKAAQYGSGTMETMRRIAKRKGMTVSAMISSIAEGLR